jgi:glucose/arabinose dehydrogenase
VRNTILPVALSKTYPMKKIFVTSLVIICAISCQNANEKAKEENTTSADTVITKTEELNLPEPYATKSVKNPGKIIGWTEGRMPIAPEGFTVSRFADSLDHPRWIYVGDNGDVFIAESNSPHSALDKLTGKNKSADRITLLRDDNKDGIPETRTVFLKGLNKPFGMLIIGDNFYVANTDGVIQFPYKAGQTAITGSGKKIVSLPPGPRHWTRNIVTNAAKNKIYIAVGSASNVGENGLDKERRRACILEINLDGSGERIYASGLRNPVGMDWAPGSNTLWTAVNERDELGDDLVPDYLTSVRDGGFYGWPYFYFGQHEDPRLKDTPRPESIMKAIVPEVPLGSHTASLGLAFYNANAFPAKYRGGAFIGQHGSWNRSVLSGYKVVYVPFKNGVPSGKMEDFLTGFISSATEVYGRPVGVTLAKDGSLLVADDGANIIWRVAKR